jgi:hypothetical protein
LILDKTNMSRFETELAVTSVPILDTMNRSNVNVEVGTIISNRDVPTNSSKKKLSLLLAMYLLNMIQQHL